MHKLMNVLLEKELSGRQFHYLYIHKDMEITNLLHFGTRPELTTMARRKPQQREMLQCRHSEQFWVAVCY
jgi:hypothetical protein